MRFKILKNKLLIWNKYIVGNLENRANNVSTFIEKYQLSLEDLQLQALTKEYLKILKQIEIKWAQKSRIQWLMNGDNNTKLFHTEVKVRRHRNRISSIENNKGIFISDPNLIADAGISYFQTYDSLIIKLYLINSPSLTYVFLKLRIMNLSKFRLRKKLKKSFGRCLIIRALVPTDLARIFTGIHGISSKII